MVTSDFRPEVKIWPFRACAMHPAIIIGTVRSLWTWLWGRYYVPQNVFLVSNKTTYLKYKRTSGAPMIVLCPAHIWYKRKNNVIRDLVAHLKQQKFVV